MLRESYTEKLDVELTKDERDLRGRQAARIATAIKAHKAKTEEEEKTWKERKAKLKSDEETMTSTLYEVSRAAETGKEPREVECREELVGGMVIQVRVDTSETVGSRAATKQEMMPAARATSAAAKDGTPEDRDARIQRKIVEHCAKPRTESLLHKALTKDCPSATPLELTAAISAAVEAGVVVEQDGKLLAVGAPPSDDGIVDDGYGLPPH